MCGSMVDIQSPTAEIRRGKKKRRKKDRNHRARKKVTNDRMKMYMALHRAAIKKPQGKNIMSTSATHVGHK